jgi:hypothetical protein
MSPREKLWIAIGLAGAGLLLLLGLTVGGTAASRARHVALKSWNDRAFKARYVESQLRDMDNGSATLTLSYDLVNLTNTDYHFAPGPGLIVAKELVTGGGLSQEEPLHLSYPAFLPAGQTVRIAVEVTRPFQWPLEEDPAYVNKLRDFVKDRLANIRKLVVFDEASHCQFELPGAWNELQESQASY